MGKMKSVIAFVACISTVVLSACGLTLVKEQAKANNAVKKPMSSTQTFDNATGSDVMNDTEKTIYDDMDLSIFDLSRYDNAKYMQYYWDSNITYN